MKKLVATLSALSLLASVSAFAQETGTDATAADTPESCEAITGLKLELCQLRLRRKTEKAAAKGAHEAKVAKTAKKAARKAVHATIKERRTEMKKAIKEQRQGARGEIQQMRQNFRGEVKDLRQQKVRREHKAGEQSETEKESGQALLQAYGRSDASSSTRVNPGFNQKAIRPSLRSKGVRRTDSRARDSSHRSRVDRRNSLDAHARLRKNVSLPRQSEPMEVDEAQ